MATDLEQGERSAEQATMALDSLFVAYTQEREAGERRSRFGRD